MPTRKPLKLRSVLGGLVWIALALGCGPASELGADLRPDVHKPTTRPVVKTGPVLRAELAHGKWREHAVLTQVYGSADAALRFTAPTGLSQAGLAAATALSQLPNAHGLDASAYPIEQVERLKVALSSDQKSLTTRIRLELTLADGLARLARDLGLDNARPAALRQRWKERRRWRALTSRARPDEDGRLWGWRYAAHAARWLIAPEVLARAASTDGPPDPRLFVEEHVRRLLAEGIARIEDRRDVASLLAASTPPIRQYDRLVGALTHYRKIVRQGGWQGLGSTRGLRAGRRHRAVAGLRQRLALEGYLSTSPADGTDKELFDRALVEAVRAYQRNHQLDVTGKPDRVLIASLDVSAERRLAVIERGLRRWRRSAAGGTGIEVRINIAGFSLEVWRGSQRLMRQRIVVGKRHGTRCDEHLAQKVPAFRTPLLSSQIERVVFCPYWNVTQTIKETELDPERGKDPLYYHKHGYELLREGTPFEWVRQLPGPENALGLAKLIFANPYEIYLHDTPEKHLFARPRRSYSHGCMRVADVLGLTKLLLQADGQWQEELFGKLHRRWKSMRFAALRKEWNADHYAELVKRAEQLRRVINLRRPIPIHVEYHTVRVDDHGRVAFYDDVYGLEKPQRSGRRCVPDSVRARRGFAALLQRLTALETKLAPLTERVAKAIIAGRELLPPQAKLPGPQRRLRRRLARLERFSQDHTNLAQRIRDEHAAVDGPIHRSHRRRVAQAVRVQRLLDALGALHHRATTTCDRLERLQARRAPPKP